MKLSKTRRIRAKRIKQIQEAIDSGASSVKEISNRTGIRVNIIYNYERYIDIPFIREKVNKSTTKSRIEKAIAEGINTLDELQIYLREVYSENFKKNTLGTYVLNFGISFPRGKSKTQIRKEQIEHAIADGAGSIKELQVYIPDLSNNTLRHYISEFKIKTGFKRGCSSYRVYHRIDENVCEGFTLQEFGDLEGITREAVRGYLHRKGLHEKWKIGRQKYKEQEN